MKILLATHNAHKLSEFQAILNNDTTPKMILGGGSNVLFTKNYPGLVIKNEITGIEIIDRD